MTFRDAANSSGPKLAAQELPLWTALRGGVENFQLDRSCAMLLLAGAAMAAFGVGVAVVAGAVREVDITWWVAFLVGAAALSAFFGGWIWRRSRRLGVRPLGLRIVAVANLFFAVPFFTLSAIARGPDERWRAGGDLFSLGFWIFWAVVLWRMGGASAPAAATPAAPEEPPAAR
ncbi:MAG: hypothetical protein AMXMBFR36_15220 [Acidobacteriota bacterium]